MSLAAALLAAQREFPPIAKDRTNPFHKSKYATLDAVLDAVRPVLNRHGLVLTQSVIAPDRDETGHVAAFTIQTTLLHESGEHMESTVVMPLAKSDPQGAGGAITYGRRYGIQLMLGVTADEDNDGNDTAPAKKSPPRREAVSPPAASKPTPASGPVWPFVGEHQGKAIKEIPIAFLAEKLPALEAAGTHAKLVGVMTDELAARS